MIGGTIRRYRTYLKYLDGQPGADPDAYYGPDVWRIERKMNQNSLYLEYELASWIDQQNLNLPGRQVIRDYCLARYRIYQNGKFFYFPTDVACPYAGTSYWDQFGTSQSNPALDVCGKQKSDCRLRYPEPDSLPSWSFYGVERIDIAGGLG
jgi:lambda family phage minor tail protein L